jgi:hypothetical protein
MIHIFSMQIMIGPTLFILGMMPSYIPFIRNYYISVCLNIEYEQSTRYDDELVQNVNLTLYDIQHSQSRSMEKQALSRYIVKLRSALENRHKLYSNILHRISNGRTGAHYYYESRLDEFRDLLSKFSIV